MINIYIADSYFLNICGNWNVGHHFLQYHSKGKREKIELTTKMTINYYK